MGIDIRNMGTDPDEGGTTSSDPSWSMSGPGNSSIGSGVPGSTSGGSAPGVGSHQWNQILQNIHNSINSYGTAPTIGFANTPKLNDLFAVDFLGFNFGSVNAAGTPNIDIMEDAIVAVGSLKRDRSGWCPFDIALIDDEESDVIRIVHRQMDEQSTNGEMFDMNIRFYDKQGNETSTAYLVDCEFTAIETDPLNMATAHPHTPQKVVVTVHPKLVRYA